MGFAIDRFLDMSKAVTTTDLDWSYIQQTGVTDDEARALRYMSDVESHTIIFLRDLLHGHTARDREITAFLACWVYEETHHGRAIDKFLNACGRPREQNRFAQVIKDAGFKEQVEAFFTTNLAKATPHFAATHMAWGAIQEMMAASAYTQLAYYTRNRELSKLLLRMAKDERRHQAFYYSQAERRMNHPFALAMATLAMKKFWSPVGLGVGETRGLEFIACLLFDDERGQEELRHMDHMFSRLPGFGWWQGAVTAVNVAIEDFRRKEPQRAQQIKDRKLRSEGSQTASEKAEWARHTADDRA
jgi:rubrerythrin